MAGKKQTTKLWNAVFHRDRFWDLSFFFPSISTIFHSVRLDLFDPIIFAADTNLFYSDKDINTVFLKVNDELQKINE